MKSHGFAFTSTPPRLGHKIDSTKKEGNREIFHDEISHFHREHLTERCLFIQARA